MNNLAFLFPFLFLLLVLQEGAVVISCYVVVISSGDIFFFFLFLLFPFHDCVDCFFSHSVLTGSGHEKKFMVFCHH